MSHTARKPSSLFRCLAAAVIAVALAGGVRAFAASFYAMRTDSAAPAVPKGAWVLVDKLGTPVVGDIVLYERDGRSHIAAFESLAGKESVVGRVSLVWR